MLTSTLPPEDPLAAVRGPLRTPSRIDRDLFRRHAALSHRRRTAWFVSEKLIAWELGYRTQLNPSFVISDKLLSYYNDLRSSTAEPALALSGGKEQRAAGADRGSRVDRRWAGDVLVARPRRLSELRVHSEPQPGTSDRSTRTSIARDPNHQAMIRSFLDIGGGWEWDTMLRYVAPIGNSPCPATPISICGRLAAGAELGSFLNRQESVAPTTTQNSTGRWPAVY